VLKCSAIRPVREEAGLGNPPEMFTTNASESLNAVIKSKVDYQKNELNKFIEKMRCLVDDQQKEVERAVCRRGKYTFRSNYQFLEVKMNRWFTIVLCEFLQVTTHGAVCINHNHGVVMVLHPAKLIYSLLVVVYQSTLIVCLSTPP